MSITLRMMMAAAVCFVLAHTTLCGAEKYDIRLISPELLPADAVVRESSAHLTVKSYRKAVYDVTYAVTIFSKDKQDEGRLYLPYGRYLTIDDLDGTIYDAAGEEVRELKKSDVKDWSTVDENTLEDESRVRLAALFHDTYPYTVEFRYTLIFKTSLDWPRWIAQSDKFPVVHSSYTVSIPEDIPLRVWCNKPDMKAQSTRDGSVVNHVWELKNLPGMAEDEELESPYDIATVVHVAPVHFQVEDFEGSMETWKDFGLWFEQLYRNRPTLPENVQQEVRTLVKPAQTEREKVKLLYEYMQSRTRYMSIQLGIGGWQPFEASYVHQRGYADCKGLSCYMDALLRAAGIRSFPVLINAGRRRIPMITEFPSNQFNHVILCVPQPKDTIWLECTSQSMPFGRLSDFTENRPALLVSDSGGTVVHTPVSRAEDNIQRREVNAVLFTTGSIDAQMTWTSSGNQQVDLQQALLFKSPEDRQTWLLERLKMPNVSMSSLSIAGLENRSPEITVRMSATLGRYAALNSSRLFFNPSLLTRTTYVPAENKARKSPVPFDYPYLNIDSIYIALPKAFTIETLPKDVAVHASFGSFTSRTIALGDSALVYLRRTEMKDARIPAEKYGEYRSFRQEMVKADKAQAVLRLKQ